MNYELLPINSIELDLNNPRIKQYIEMYGECVTAEGIALALGSSGDSSSSSFAALRESIKVNKGLINPIIVNRQADGKLVVIEGNTRLQIYRDFLVSDPNGPWKEIIALVHENLSDEEIHAIRLQTHLVGPREWDRFSKAKYLNELSNIDKLPLEKIISFCGGKKNEIMKLIQAYTDMVQYYFPEADNAEIDPNPKEFSKFEELQNRSVTEALVLHNFNKTDFAKWVVNGNIDTAQHVRDLPAILNDKDATEVFLKSTISEAEKIVHTHETSKGQDLSALPLDDLVRAIIRKIRDIQYSEIKALRNNTEKQEAKNRIYELKEEIDELIPEIEED